MEGYDENKKRVRDDLADSPANTPETKRLRLDADDDSDAKFYFESPDFEQIGVVTTGDFALELPEVKSIRDDLLNILDDSEQVNSPIQGLDFVIRSLEEEIHPLHVGNEAPTASGGSLPELGYLLGASDDELGIPPTVGLEEEGENDVFNFQGTGSSAASDFDGISPIPSYDPFDIGVGGEFGRLSNDDDDIILSRDFVGLDGLFDFTDVVASEFTFRTESLSAMM